MASAHAAADSPPSPPETPAETPDANPFESLQPAEEGHGDAARHAPEQPDDTVTTPQWNESNAGTPEPAPLAEPVLAPTASLAAAEAAAESAVEIAAETAAQDLNSVEAPPSGGQNHDHVAAATVPGGASAATAVSTDSAADGTAPFVDNTAPVANNTAPVAVGTAPVANNTASVAVGTAPVDAPPPLASSIAVRRWIPVFHPSATAFSYTLPRSPN